MSVICFGMKERHLMTILESSGATQLKVLFGTIGSEFMVTVG